MMWGGGILTIGINSCKHNIEITNWGHLSVPAEVHVHGSGRIASYLDSRAAKASGTWHGAYGVGVLPHCRIAAAVAARRAASHGGSVPYRAARGIPTALRRS